MNFKIFLLLLAIALITSCNTGTKKTEDLNTTNGLPVADTVEPDNMKQLQVLQNILNRNSGDGFAGTDIGREVAMDSALLCIGLYEPQMLRHGLEATGGRTVNLGTITTKKITTGVELGGDKLLDWMMKMVSLLDPAGHGKNLSFVLKPGILTEDFLKKYHPDEEELRTKKKNRISIFIVPIGRGSFKFRPDDEPSAYELGGLQP